ncbi:RNA polymerase sigma factor [Streptomyces sp. NBC_01518]|uniref:RNA polymerase sigma factor n=1 Tax=Streptomyces sp. NBC_01518 TaxID=2903891 RepID=UPI0038689084
MRRAQLLRRPVGPLLLQHPLPDAVFEDEAAAWLRTIVRNARRQVVREAAVVRPVGELPLQSTHLGPEQWLERNTLRDWVWEALEELSPALRMPLVLRHFATGVTSYERIAEVCGVPVGTVRSRLSQGRTKLAAALAATADAPHGDAGQRVHATRVEAHELLAAVGRKGLGPGAELTPDRISVLR